MRHSLDSQIRQSGRESKSLIELGRSESTLFLKPYIYIDIFSRICQQPRSQCPRKLTDITKEIGLFQTMKLRGENSKKVDQGQYQGVLKVISLLVQNDQFQ